MDTMDFAPEADQPVSYMARTRAWYLALGYDNPYRWAHYLDVPFTTLQKPLAQNRVALITTAAPFNPEHGDQSPQAPYNAKAKFYEVYTGSTSEDHDVRIVHVAIDRQHGPMTDANSWFPLPKMRALAEQEVFELGPRFYGAPTNRSQRQTLESDCPRILELCREDGIDAVVLVANCPVCHQTLSLIARHLEAHGISTVIMGCAKDIPEYCGVPRFLFSDFPLGNAAGKPHDEASQQETLEMALTLLERAFAPRTTVQSPQRWSDDADWKLDYSNPDRTSPEEMAKLRAQADEAKAEIARLKGKEPPAPACALN
ncbi:reductase [Orrella sp. 11846]|uniref:reductase n=1 Tax=Orrella sp. 11846 TaxID=3409913 RepID=UPI003B59C618